LGDTLTSTVSWIHEDQEQNIWFGTYGSGVFRYDGTSIIRLTADHGLTSNYVKTITEDKAGNLWIATYGGGISCYRGKSLINFTKQMGLAHNMVWGMAEDSRGLLWFGTSGGLSFYNGERFTNITTRQGLAGNYVNTIIEDHTGNLWFGTSGGVSQFDGSSITNLTTQNGLLSNTVYAIVEDHTGNLWFGTSRGLSRFNGESFYNFTENQGLPGGVIRSLFEDTKGRLWIGTTTGLYLFDGTSFIYFMDMPKKSIINALSIFEDDFENIWISSRGIYRFDGNSFLRFTKGNGLPDNAVSQGIVDAQGNLLFGTNSGLGVFVSFKKEGLNEENTQTIPTQNNLKNQELANYTPIIEIYNTTTGYPIKDANVGQPGILEDRNGNIWLATGSDKTALVRFDNSAVNRNPNPLSVFIRSIKVNKEHVCWHGIEEGQVEENDSLIPTSCLIEESFYFGIISLSDADWKIMRDKFKNIKIDGVKKFYPIPENLILPIRFNEVTFNFGSDELLNPNQVEYSYILEGDNSKWSSPTSTTSVDFGNLHEGRYTFKIKARRPNERWNEPISYSFRVLPPWHRTWWAFLGYIVLAILAIITIVNLYTGRLVKRNKLLQGIITTKEKVQAELLIAKDKAEESDRLKSAFLANMSHEIRTPMNGILGFTGLLKEADLTGEEQKMYIGIIETSGDRLLNIITNIVTYSRLEAGAVDLNLSETNINDQLDYIYTLFRSEAERKGITLTCIKKLPDDQAIIKTDKDKIYSILSNLVKNALNFTETGSIKFGCEQRGHLLEFYVKDTGIGIAEDQKSIIFSRFRQSSEELTRTQEGAGLGLSIAKGYVEVLGGDIWMESKEGQGSTFYFTIAI